MSVEGDPSGGGIGGAVASVRVELASPTTFFESNMNIVSIIKAADVRIGSPVTIPAPPVIRWAPAAEPVVRGPAPLELASPAAFFESNINIVSMMVRFNPQQLSPPKTASLTKEGAVAEAEHWLQQSSYKQPEVLPPLIAQPNKEELVTESVQDTKPAGIPQYSEASDEFRLISVEDEKTAGQRREEIKAAIKKAFLAVEKLGLGGIVGKLVAKFLPKEHEGIRSQIIKRYGPDGSLVDTFQAIADVARVLKYLVIRPGYAYEIFIKRTIKKKIPINQPSNEPVEVKTENSLEDYPQLQAVFSGLTDSNSLS